MDSNMDTKQLPQKYGLSRQAASRLLKVSIRTLDRYVRAKKVSTYVHSGRIWLNKKEISQLKNGKTVDSGVDRSAVSTLKMSIDNHVDRYVDRVDNEDVIEPAFYPKISKKRNQDSHESFENLYSELKIELKEKQERLEIANYRVGQLENQVRNSIPMLEYHRENYEKQKVEEALRNQILDSSQLIKNLNLNIKYIKFSKRIFLVSLLIILALQPLWLYYFYR